METENTKDQDRNDADMPVFMEYSNNRKGWPFITIVQTVEGKRRVTGRIYREYDNDNKKAIYKAYNGQGDLVFSDLPDLVSIKKAFVVERETLALSVWKNHSKGKESDIEIDQSREAGLIEIREQRKGKKQTKGIEK